MLEWVAEWRGMRNLAALQQDACLLGGMMPCRYVGVSKDYAELSSQHPLDCEELSLAPRLLIESVDAQLVSERAVDNFQSFVCSVLEGRGHGFICPF